MEDNILYVDDEKLTEAAFKLDSIIIIDMVNKFSNDDDLGAELRQYVNYLMDPDIYD